MTEQVMPDDLQKDLIKGYNALMASLLKSHGARYGATALRLIVARHLTAHALDRAVEAVSKALEPNDQMTRLLGLLAAGQTPHDAARMIAENDGNGKAVAS